MSSIGPYYPLTCTDNNYDGYGLTWSSPGGATTVGGASASVSVNTAGSTGSDTHYLKASNFGFSVPSSTINGIEVVIVGSSSWVTGYKNVNVFLIKSDGSAGSETKGPTGISGGWSPTFSPLTAGNSSTLWGNAWTNTDINSSNFGAYFRCRAIPTAQCFSGDVKVSTPTGSIRIDEIKIGDEVLSYNEDMEIVNSRITGILHREKISTKMVTVETCCKNSITSTHNHQFLTSTGFKEAMNLTPGEIIYFYDDFNVTECEIAKISIQDDELDLYDIEVETHHTFIADGFLVHNFAVLSNKVIVDSIGINVYYTVSGGSSFIASINSLGMSSISKINDLTLSSVKSIIGLSNS